MKKVLIVADSDRWYKFAEDLAQNPLAKLADVDVYQSAAYHLKLFGCMASLSNVNVGDAQEADRLAHQYDLVLSLHCQQIFHKNLTQGTLCINLHPGILPGGRGWNPYVFAMAYRGAGDVPAGATLHIMDEMIDHGPIIASNIVPIESTDTCDTLYERVLEVEESLIAEWLPKILDGKYQLLESPTLPYNEVKTRDDYEKLCYLDLPNLNATQLLRRLAALTYQNQKNAYFVDDMGNVVHVGVFFGKDV